MCARAKYLTQVSRSLLFLGAFRAVLSIFCHLWEVVAFFGFNCSISSLTTIVDYSPLGIAFHPRGFYLPGSISLPFLPRFSTSPAYAGCGNLTLRTFCVNTATVSTAVSLNHFCYFASAFTLWSARQPPGIRHYLSLLNLLFPHLSPNTRFGMQAESRLTKKPCSQQPP